ncbi:MAG: hypothetical protein U1F87_12615 [Kiritimatiellia bacterium]
MILPKHQIRLRQIHQLDKVSEVMPTLGLDVSHRTGRGVKHYSRDVAKWAKGTPARASGTPKIRIPRRLGRAEEQVLHPAHSM